MPKIEHMGSSWVEWGVTDFVARGGQGQAPDTKKPASADAGFVVSGLLLLQPGSRSRIGRARLLAALLLRLESSGLTGRAECMGRH
jgi:hypothetical protein